MQRHGEGWHNVAQQDLHIGPIEWQCYWSIRDGKDGIEWYDAELTPKGHQQINSLVSKIKIQVHSHTRINFMLVL